MVESHPITAQVCRAPLSSYMYAGLCQNFIMPLSPAQRQRLIGAATDPWPHTSRLLYNYKEWKRDKWEWGERKGAVCVWKTHLFCTRASWKRVCAHITCVFLPLAEYNTRYVLPPARRESVRGEHTFTAKTNTPSAEEWSAGLLFILFCLHLIPSYWGPKYFLDLKAYGSKRCGEY